ncbi:MAG: tetratricopeptide repeat protein [Pseudomonadales bacterium]|jgi:tetratricopeptide (TPR) repeat protein
MDELSKELTESIKALCSEGYDLYDQKQWERALRVFYRAWNKLPKPQTSYRESGWVLTALGDTYFKAARFRPAKEALNSALHCPGINYNPFVLLRLGQSLLEQGDADKAHQTLAFAYKKGGRQLFESEAPKYLLAALQPPANKD